MTSLTSTTHGFERMLDLSRHLTRGVEAPAASSAPRAARRPAPTTWVARVAERWAQARAVEAWQELARHDHRMAQELKAALLRDR